MRGAYGTMSLAASAGRPRRASTRQEVAVAFRNLDRFKTVNDSLDHHAGDQVLVEVTQRQRQLLREADIVGRLGGDGFVAELGQLEYPDAAPPGVRKAARTAQRALRGRRPQQHARLPPRVHRPEQGAPGAGPQLPARPGTRQERRRHLRRHLGSGPQPGPAHADRRGRTRRPAPLDAGAGLSSWAASAGHRLGHALSGLTQRRQTWGVA